jgi:hypothetical protein
VAKRHSWLRRKTKSVAKKLWTKHKQNKKLRRKERQTARKERRTVARASVQRGGFGVARPNAAPPQPAPAPKPAAPSPLAFAAQRRRRVSRHILVRHPLVSGVKDTMSCSIHSIYDRRELRSGIITAEELEAFEQYDSQEEWRLDMLARRQDQYKRQRARRVDGEHGPLTMVYSIKDGVARVEHKGFRPPAPRQSSKKTNAPTWQPQPRQTIIRKKKSPVSTLVKAWGPQMTENARNAMAADSNLSGAVSALQSFAEQFPESRSQVHEHLGKMAEFGKSFSDAIETFKATLAQGKNEDNPGLPPEVISRLNPLTDVGSVIERTCQETLASWEDYFADAIKVAQDEHTPSKQALMS